MHLIIFYNMHLINTIKLVATEACIYIQKSDFNLIFFLVKQKTYIFLRVLLFIKKDLHKKENNP
jgi:hypothetical protein